MSIDLAYVEHPRTNEHLELVRDEVAKLGRKECRHVVLTGNFAYTPLADVDKQQEREAAEVARIFADNDYQGDALDVPLARMSGYALQIDGDAKVDTPERLAAVLGGYKLGTGTDVFLCASVPDVLRGNDEEAIKQTMRSAADALPHLMGEHHRISLQRYAGGREEDRYALFVTANDMPAARTLVQYAAARAARKMPLSVAELVESPAYQHVQYSSEVLRQALAAQYARALGITLHSDACGGSHRYSGHKRGHHHHRGAGDDGTSSSSSSDDEDELRASMEARIGDRTYLPIPLSLPSAEHLSPTHFARENNVLAHGVPKSATTAYETREPTYFVVYNDACDTSDARTSVVMSHGLLGGSSIVVHGDNDQMPWHQPKLLSAMPSNSSLAYGDDTKRVAEHAHSSAKAQQAFDSRVAWRTDTSMDMAHRHTNQRYYAIDDPRVRTWLQHHAAKNADGSEQPLVTQRWTFIAGQLPDESTLDASLAHLAAVARLKSTPKNVPVLLSNAIVGRVHQLYDSKLRSAFNVSMNDIFRNTYDAELAVNAPVTMTRGSALSVEHARSGAHWGARLRRWWNNMRGVPDAVVVDDGDSSGTDSSSGESSDSERAPHSQGTAASIVVDRGVESSESSSDHGEPEIFRMSLGPKSKKSRGHGAERWMDDDERLFRQLYADAGRYGMSTHTGAYVSHSVPLVVGAQLDSSATCTHTGAEPAHKQCVDARWLEAQRHAPHEHAPTVLMLNKEMINAITPEP